MPPGRRVCASAVITQTATGSEKPRLCWQLKSL
jgi:hypothetical protein